MALDTAAPTSCQLPAPGCLPGLRPCTCPGAGPFPGEEVGCEAAAPFLALPRILHSTFRAAFSAARFCSLTGLVSVSSWYSALKICFSLFVSLAVSLLHLSSERLSCWRVAGMQPWSPGPRVPKQQLCVLSPVVTHPCVHTPPGWLKGAQIHGRRSDERKMALF